MEIFIWEMFQSAVLDVRCFVTEKRARQSSYKDLNETSKLEILGVDKFKCL